MNLYVNKSNEIPTKRQNYNLVNIRLLKQFIKLFISQCSFLSFDVIK